METTLFLFVDVQGENPDSVVMVQKTSGNATTSLHAQ